MIPRTQKMNFKQNKKKSFSNLCHVAHYLLMTAVGSTQFIVNNCRKYDICAETKVWSQS